MKKTTETPVVSTTALVKDVSPLNQYTYQIELVSTSDSIFSYRAGQYLQLEVDLNDNGKPQLFSYSIANHLDPEDPRRLQLLIQSGGEISDKIIAHLLELHKNGRDINITLPMGKAFLQTNLELKHVLVAAGSGIAKIKAITEQILSEQPNADVSIYWSNKQADEFYLEDEFQHWKDKNKNLTITLILESRSIGWQGRSGYIFEVIKEDFNDLHKVKSYLCGSPKMVYGTIDKLKSIGLQEENCHSDVFEYAPRNQISA